MVAFFDVSDPLHIQGAATASLRIARDSARDAAAVGITTFTRNGQIVWLVRRLRQRQRGLLSSRQTCPGWCRSSSRGSRPRCRVGGEGPPGTCCSSPTSANRVFAAGLNRGNVSVLRQAGGVRGRISPASTMTPDPDRVVLDGRWHAACAGARPLEVVGNRLDAALHRAQLRHELRHQHVRVGTLPGYSLRSHPASRRRARTSSKKASARKGTAKKTARKPKRRD